MKSNIGILIILSIVLAMCSININAQTVGYTYRPLAAEGCNMKYSVAKQGYGILHYRNRKVRQTEFPERINHVVENIRW